MPQATIKKILATKRKNNTFNSSKVQDILQAMFCALYDDCEVEYNKDPRYPYACDIYIPRFDLFIEINGT